MSRLTICADDFAISEGVSRVISELAGTGKVNAISCMAISPRWPADAEFLSTVPKSVEIGLHLVLTDEAPLTPAPRLSAGGRLPPSSRLERMAVLRQAPLEDAAAEIEAQFTRFEEVIGRPPSFVDGHQHVHLLPGIRQIVIEQTACRSPLAWLRSCEDRLARILRRPFRAKALISASHAVGFARRAAAAKLWCNDSFSGIYDFKASYADLFPRFLAYPGQHHLVHCHPGEADALDPIGDAREREAAALRCLPVADLARACGMSFASSA